MTKGFGLEKNKSGRLAPWRFENGDLTLSLRVQPGAGKTEPAGNYGDSALRLRLAAPAVEGRANKACIKFLAKALGVPLAAVSILRGESSRDKVLRVRSVEQTRLKSLLDRWNS